VPYGEGHWAQLLIYLVIYYLTIRCFLRILANMHAHISTDFLFKLDHIGAQFGGKYFCHDVRVVRLPRHGASLPIAIAVSCSADRQAKAKITKYGIFL